MLVSTVHGETSPLQLLTLPSATGISLPARLCDQSIQLQLGCDRRLLHRETPGPVVLFPWSMLQPHGRLSSPSSDPGTQVPSSSQLGIAPQTEAVQARPASVRTVSSRRGPKEELPKAQIQRLGMFDAGTRGLHGDDHVTRLGPRPPGWGQPRALQRVAVEQGRQGQARVSRF